MQCVFYAELVALLLAGSSFYFLLMTRFFNRYRRQKECFDGGIFHFQFSGFISVTFKISKKISKIYIL